MKILLTHSYFLHLDPKEAAVRKPYPPLAPLILAAWLKQELGLDVTFYDVMFDRDEASLIQAIRAVQPEVFILYDDDFNYLTKMCLENMRRAIFRAIATRPAAGLFIAHGSDAADQAEAYLHAGFDVVIHRQAEQTVVNLLKICAQNPADSGLLALDGLSYLTKQGGVYHQNPLPRANFDLEKSPAPLWDKIDLTPYRRMWQAAHGYFSLNVSTSHGCPYHCNWCAKPLYGRIYKALPARRVAEQFAYLQQQLKADHVWMTDDIFALKPGWLAEFGDCLTALNAHLPYKCLSRADLITPEFAAELARSGCAEVWLGAESGSQKILDAMDKNMKVSEILTATKRLREQQIKVGFFLQYGYPGEEFADIQLTLNLIKTCLPDHIGISVSYPLKGTPFYERVAGQMGAKKNWADSGDLALMFPGSYPPDFYRALHQYTHHYFGFLSLRRPMPWPKKLRRLAAQIRHIPGLIKYRRQMSRFLEPSV